MTVYVDRLFAVNLVLDYLLLLSTAQLLGLPLRRLRLGVAALLGGLYAVLAVCVPWCGRLGMQALCGVVMAAAAFWGTSRFWRAAGLFWLLSGTLAGILMILGLSGGMGVYYLRVGWGTLLASAAVFYLVLTLGFPQFCRHGRGELMAAEIEAWGRRCTVRVLRDTGNTLRDPVEGKPVLIVETGALKEIWPRPVQEILERDDAPEEKMALLCTLGYTCFTLLPFQSIGQTGGLLLALRCDRLTVGTYTEKHVLVALYQEKIGNGRYHGLWGGECDELVAEAAGMGIVHPAGRRILHRRQRYPAAAAAQGGGSGTADQIEPARSGGAADADRAQSPAGGIHREAV